MNRSMAHAALDVQRVWRGHRDRVAARAGMQRRVWDKAALQIQRVWRGHRGRESACAYRRGLLMLRKMESSRQPSETAPEGLDAGRAAAPSTRDVYSAECMPCLVQEEDHVVQEDGAVHKEHAVQEDRGFQEVHVNQDPVQTNPVPDADADADITDAFDLGSEGQLAAAAQAIAQAVRHEQVPDVASQKRPFVELLEAQEEDARCDLQRAEARLCRDLQEHCSAVAGLLDAQCVERAEVVALHECGVAALRDRMDWEIATLAARVHGSLDCCFEDLPACELGDRARIEGQEELAFWRLSDEGQANAWAVVATFGQRLQAETQEVEELEVPPRTAVEENERRAREHLATEERQMRRQSLLLSKDRLLREDASFREALWVKHRQVFVMLVTVYQDGCRAFAEHQREVAAVRIQNSFRRRRAMRLCTARHKNCCAEAKAMRQGLLVRAVESEQQRMAAADEEAAAFGRYQEWRAALRAVCTSEAEPRSAIGRKEDERRRYLTRCYVAGMLDRLRVQEARARDEVCRKEGEHVALFGQLRYELTTSYGFRVWAGLFELFPKQEHMDRQELLEEEDRARGRLNALHTRLQMSGERLPQNCRATSRPDPDPGREHDIDEVAHCAIREMEAFRGIAGTEAWERGADSLLCAGLHSIVHCGVPRRRRMKAVPDQQRPTAVLGSAAQPRPWAGSEAVGAFSHSPQNRRLDFRGVRQSPLSGAATSKPASPQQTAGMTGSRLGIMSRAVSSSTSRGIVDMRGPLSAIAGSASHQAQNTSGVHQVPATNSSRSGLQSLPLVNGSDLVPPSSLAAPAGFGASRGGRHATASAADPQHAETTVMPSRVQSCKLPYHTASRKATNGFSTDMYAAGLRSTGPVPTSSSSLVPCLNDLDLD